MVIKRLPSKRKALLCCLFLLFIFPGSVGAHSGRTDANGGHNCYVGSCAGTYHYHNGGSDYTAPATPDYYQQGITNGRAHAEREAENIRTKTKASGYQSGYSASISGESQRYYVSHPDSICDISFTFDPGTNETYKTWYKSGWLNSCNVIARSVYQASFDEGYTAGLGAKPVPTSSISTDSNNASTSTPSTSDNLGWVSLGIFITLLLIAAAWSGIKDR